METAKAPIVNVWSVRKEQLAARATSSSTTSSASSFPSTVPSSSSTNASSATPSAASTRPQRVGSVSKVPPVSDEESWPDVTASLSKEVGVKEKIVKDSELQPKKEKTKKWVPIPAKELQAAADAHRAASSSSKKHSSGDGARDRSSTRRNPNRGPPSQAASTSQSRVQSRSGSVQSSPRNTGRRRLPAERDSDDARGLLKPGSTHRPSSSARSSKSNSPHPHLTQLPQTLLPMPHPSLPLPPHLAYGTPFQPYPGYPPQLVPFGLSPVLTPLGADGSVDGAAYPFYSAALYNSTRNLSSNGYEAARAAVQFGSLPPSTAAPTESAAITVDSGATNQPSSTAEPTGQNELAGRQLVIGVAPEEVDAVVRAVKNVAINGGSGSGPGRIGKERSRRSSLAVPSGDQDSSAAATSDSKGKWGFGTASEGSTAEGEVVAQVARLLDVVAEDGTPLMAKLSPLSMSLSASPRAGQTPLAPAGPTSETAGPPPGLGLPQPQRPPGLAAKKHMSRPTTHSNSPPLTGPVRGISSPANDEDFEVKDYGFGFGQGGARTGDPTQEEIIAKEKASLKERQRALVAAAHSTVASQPHSHHHASGGRDDRRGGAGSRMPRPFDGDRERDRGDRGGSRRNGPRGSGLGGAGGGGGGGPHNRNRRGSATHTGPSPPPGPLPPFGHHPHAPPLHIPPFMPQPFMHGNPLPPGVMPPGVDGMPSPTYYGPIRPGFMPQPPTGAVSFLPPLPPAPPLPPQLLPLAGTSPPSAVSPTASVSSGAPVVAPPVPAPLTVVPFPLDPTRYYLLGQLEYYLSPQNMAKDFFLKKKMDSKGWIPISLIASFNRVKKLTQDANLVKEVLYLSSMVQVRDEWVRMGGWERFVLPDAEESIVPDFDGGANLNHPPYPMLNGLHVGPPPPAMFSFGAPSPPGSGPKRPNGVSNGVRSPGTEDEDDVEFVLESGAA